MKKLASELKRGDKIEFLDGTIGIVETVLVDDNQPHFSTIHYENGSRNFCLTDEEIEIMKNDLTTI
jgi:preprotein translocase subunit YajC